jgi:hypothetical protein
VDEPQRDAVIDRELGRTLRDTGASADGPHLDAEVAAAWTERRLDAEAAQAAELHLASCADCQALVATLVRISPEPEAVHQAAGGWWAWLRRPWLVPLAGAAAAGAVWIAMPGNETPVPESSQARLVVPLQSVPEERGFARQSAESSAAVAPDRLRVAMPGDAATGASARENESKAVAAPAPANAVPPQAKAAAAAPPPPAAAAEAFAAPLARADSTLERSVAQPDAPAPPAAPREERQEATAAESRRLFRDLGALQQIAAGNVTTVAADGVARWRRRGAAIEFAGRADASFAAAAVPGGAADVSSGSAPGGTVCWFVGRAGLVLVTTDGLRFTRTPAPASIDLTAVTATDARSAIVTAADGRRFRTTDGGATWSVAP